MWRINSSKTFIALLLLFILVDPFLPVYLDVLIFLFLFSKARPERLALVFFYQNEEKVEAGFGPFRLLFVDLLTELKCKAVFFRATFSFKWYGGWSKIYFLFGNVLKLNFNEYPVFTLGPLDQRMPFDKINAYNIGFR